jgi:hypothetical protein
MRQGPLSQPFDFHQKLAGYLCRALRGSGDAVGQKEGGAVEAVGHLIPTLERSTSPFRSLRSNFIGPSHGCADDVDEAREFTVCPCVGKINLRPDEIGPVRSRAECR